MNMLIRDKKEKEDKCKVEKKKFNIMDKIEICGLSKENEEKVREHIEKKLKEI